MHPGVQATNSIKLAHDSQQENRIESIPAEPTGHDAPLCPGQPGQMPGAAGTESVDFVLFLWYNYL